MKNKKLTFLIFAFAILFINLKSFAQEFNGVNAQNVIDGAEKIVIDPSYTIPTFVKFRTGSEIEFANWESWLKKLYKFSNGIEFLLKKTESDEIGYTNYRFQQIFQSMEVLGADIVIHVKNNKVISINGKIRNKIDVEPTNIIFENDALQKALSFTNALKYKWQIPEEESYIKKINNDEKATYFPKGELVIVPENGDFKSQSFKVAYKFDIYASNPMSRKFVFVDANSGEVIFTLDRIHFDNTEVNVNASATAATKYSGSRTFMTDSYAGSYRLRETGRGLGIETYNMQTGINYGSAVDFTNATTNWTGTNANQDEVARDAHWGAEMTWDYYNIKHSRNSIDNAGMKLMSYVHYDVNYVNAFWDGAKMTYGDGDASNSPLTTLDICGHEITHGVTENTANLAYSYQSGALNEGFSDIFGVSIEFFAKPPLSVGNWTMGEEIGTPFRSMSNPNAYGQPDTYLGANWATGTGDNGGVHTNSGVLNYWYYLLCQGGTGTNDIGSAYNVSAISMAKAERIAYRTLTTYLTSSSQYSDARIASIQACVDLYGGCGNEAQQVANAWYAVGIGAAYSSAPTSADFVSACLTSQCTSPFTVQFSNTSVNANTFTWYFGDGATSTLSNPSHTYTSNGSFNVKLVALGGTCGSDSIIKNAFITVGPTYPCPVSVPGTGSGTTQILCTGTLTDSGICGNYLDNTDGSITISPSSATPVTLTFSSFNYELDYDYLYIYDGPTTASPQVAGSPFTGSTIPGPITSTGNSITLRQTTDQGLTASGFVLEWTCQLSTLPPVANFSVSATSSCIGVIDFTDVSTNGPTTWLWDFGDGQTSTMQNPSHTYIANGTYTITLTATNTYGNDAEIKINYIIINLPTAPTTIGSYSCEAAALNLSASGVGTLEWYDSPTEGVLVNTGNNYTTPLISATTNYYVQDNIIGATHNCAKPDNTGGGGYTSAGDHYLIFNCLTPVKLVSVKIYGNSTAPGSRTIELRSNTGTVLQSSTLNVLSGLNTYTLNFDIPIGTNLRLGCEGTNIFRNNSITTYPFTLSGIISVIGSDAGTGYYYYFYDWIIQEPSCISSRSIVSANIYSVPSTPVISQVGNTLISSSPTGNQWYSTPPSTLIPGEINQSYSPLINGNYYVVVTDGNLCSSLNSNDINFIYTSILENRNFDFSLMPNPNNGEFTINLGNTSENGLKITVANSIGELVFSKQLLNNNSQNISLDGISNGVYFIRIMNERINIVKKIIIQK